MDEEEKIRQFLKAICTSIDNNPSDSSPDELLDELENQLSSGIYKITDETIEELKLNSENENLTNLSNKQIKNNWFKKIFHKNKFNVVDVFIEFLSKTKSFSKSELYLVKKLELVKENEQGIISYQPRKPLSEKFYSSILGLIILLIGIKVAIILNDPYITMDDVISAWVYGILAGFLIRFIWDRTFAIKKIEEKLSDTAPWLNISHI